MPDPSPFANVLHTETIAKLARSSVLERGRTYVNRVSGLARTEARLSARVQGGGLYAVAIWVKGDRLGYVCTCPAGEKGEFCKHCVAVALAWVDKAGIDEAGAPR